MKRVSLIAVLLFTNAPARAAEPKLLHAFEKQILSEKFFSEGATIGDANHDGTPDINAGPYWYLGPDFEERIEYRPPQEFDINGYSDHFFSFTYDFNGDGWDDLLTVGFPGAEAFWYENPQGKAGHWPRHLALAVVDNESPEFANVVGDERPELVCNNGGMLGYAEWDPKNPTRPWRFQPISPDRGYQRFTHGLGVGDITGDGRPDVLLKEGWWEQPESVAEGAPWEFHEFPFSEAGGAQMLVADFDGDGDNDVVSSKAAHAYGLSWFEHVKEDGEITFREHKIMGQTPEENDYGLVIAGMHAAALVDMDRDGVMDFVTGKRYWAHSEHDPGALEPSFVHWYQTVRKDGTAHFVPHEIDNDSGVGTQVFVGNLNNDEWPDVVVGSKRGVFALTHLTREVSEEEYEDAQPKTRAELAAARPAVGEGGEYLATDADGRALNLDFETGTLRDWTAEGEAFAGQPIQDDAVQWRRNDMISGHKGSYWIGTFERGGDEPQGKLTSVAFEVTHPWASFLVGGGSSGATRVEIVRAGTGEVIFRSAGYSHEEMRPAAVDLKELLGEKIFLRIVDASSTGWGHVNFDHFRFHDEEPRVDELKPRVFKADEYPHAGLNAAGSVKAMQLPKGFSVTAFAHEPDVKQPIAMALDDRGRVWVAEAYEYPTRAPEGEGRDRILVFEDTDNDGKFDSRKVFAEGLNLVSGLEVGFGGVWVGAAPYLMFIPDADGDDVPDGEPQVLLDGWAYQDTHETLNAFTWGPDGWLYGCHGVFTHSNVGKPGASDKERTRLNAAIWRYHPTRHKFDIFAEGTSNPWGVDFDQHGHAFCTACVIPHLFHIIPGARYNRQAGSHFNPYTYADIQTIADHRHYLGSNPHAGNLKSDSAGGGHAHAGAMIYQGDAWPEEYRGRIFMNNIHGQRVNTDILTPRGSGYVGSHGQDFLLTGDLASQMLYFQTAPDGNVYVIDWYDMNACHHNNVEGHDRTNGRVYKVSYGEAKGPAKDLAKLNDVELAELALHRNEYFVRHARRLLQERAAAGDLDEAARDRLVEIATDGENAPQRLRAMWALHVTGGIDHGLIIELARDSSEHIRSWCVRLVFDEGRDEESLPAELVAALENMAKSDSSPVVRLSIASVAQHVPVEQRWGLVSALVAHGEDADDHNLPLMYWYAAEPLAAADPQQAAALAVSCSKTMPVVSEFLVRRIAAVGTPQALAALVDVAGHVEGASQQLAILQSIRQGLEGQRSVAMPANWAATAEKLLASDNEEIVASTVALGLTFGDPAALQWLRDKVAAADASVDLRLDALGSLVAARDAQLPPLLFKLLDEPAMCETALTALANFDDPATPSRLLERYASLTPEQRRTALATLCARTAFALPLLEAIAAGQIPVADLPADLVQQLKHLNEPKLDELLAATWGQVRTTPEDKAKLIAEYKELVANPPVEPDAQLGRAVFVRTCQQCHTLYGAGGAVGPDLTGSNRRDLDYLLSNIVDPSAVIAKEYMTQVVLTVDGRVISGVLAGEDEHALTIKTATETIVLPLADIEEDGRELSEISIMPEDQLKQFTPEETVSLFAYLRGDAQTPLLARLDNGAALFNGRDLTGWSGEMEYWTVENGDIVGRSPGLDHNTFLVSDMAVEDFRLSMDVKLSPNAGNSGVQFRSEPIEHGEMRGYQADIGAGWWGKLYEENGRALLWDKPGDQHVHEGDWNHYVIEAVGGKIRTWLNGELCVDLDDDQGARRGVLALQIHSGGEMEVRFRNLKLEVLEPSGK